MKDVAYGTGYGRAMAERIDSYARWRQLDLAVTDALEQRAALNLLNRKKNYYGIKKLCELLELDGFSRVSDIAKKLIEWRESVKKYEEVLQQVGPHAAANRVRVQNRAYACQEIRRILEKPTPELELALGELFPIRLKKIDNIERMVKTIEDEITH